MNTTYRTKTLTLLGAAAVTGIIGTGTASAAPLTPEPAAPLITESDSPTLGMVNFGVNADGWEVNIHNDNSKHDDIYTFRYQDNPLDNVLADKEIPAETVGHAKGVKTLIGPAPADADVLYKSEWQTIHVYLRSDNYGNTHHSCETNAPSKFCTVTQKDLAAPVEVHAHFWTRR